MQLLAARRGDFGAFNRIYLEYFPNGKPARSTTEARLMVDAKVEIDVVAYMVARYFGVTSFSTIYGLTVFFLTFSGSLSSWLLGSAYDRFGNYDLALSVMAGAFLAAGLAYLMLGRYPSRPVE